MAVERDYTLWDTVVLGAAALAETILFQVAQGGDATHTESFTNSRGAGVLPGEETFDINEIYLVIDSDILPADIKKWPFGSFLEVRVTDKTELKIPAQVASAYNDYGGDVHTAAAEFANVGQVGTGFKLTKPIRVPGATPWRVRFVQGTALVVAAKNLRVVLRGILTSPM